jgi:hypothetical protein
VVTAWICLAYSAFVPASVFDIVFVTGQRSPIEWRIAVLVTLSSAVAALAMNLFAAARAVAISKGLSEAAVNHAFLLCLGSTAVNVLISAVTSFLMMSALV